MPPPAPTSSSSWRIGNAPRGAWTSRSRTTTAPSAKVAVQRAPADGFYHYWLDDVYLQLGQLPEAVRELQAAVVCSPYDDYYCVRLGMAFSLVNRGEDAVVVFRRAIRLRPDNAS